MSKKKAYQFWGTKGDIIDLIKSLPPEPNQEFLKDWNEFISEHAPVNLPHREFYHKRTQLRVRFDYAKEGASGFEGKDHWHVYNPYTKNKRDTYLDKDGNPVGEGSNPSHIIPEKEKKED